MRIDAGFFSSLADAGNALGRDCKWQAAQRVRGIRLPQTSGQGDWAMMVVIIEEIVAA